MRHDTEPKVPPELFDGFKFDRVLQANVVSIALGRPPKVAVLADAPYVSDGHGFRKRELPETHRAKPGQIESVDIFFGRDNQPRLMGTRSAPDAPPQAIYFRHFSSGWRLDPKELGPLSRSKTGLYGILGFEDPEILCSPGAFCLVKRITGWSRIPADAARVPMFLTPFGVYKAHQRELLKLEGKTWKKLGPLSFEPQSLCHETEARLWICALEEARLYLRDLGLSEDFQPVDLPLAVPRALYCAGEAAVWAVGDGGAAYYDGKVWQKVEGDFSGLRVVTGRGTDEIWLGGESGLFLGRPKQGTEVD